MCTSQIGTIVPYGSYKLELLMKQIEAVVIKKVSVAFPTMLFVFVYNIRRKLIICIKFAFVWEGIFFLLVHGLYFGYRHI